MNGAEALVRTLLDSEVDVVFANPGTSEMHFVAALESAPGIRYVPCLFEGVASAAADGYARMTGRPAATLLHLGPGLANAQANLHNALKARSPIVNIVGEHATFHREAESPLSSDVPAIAQPFSHWVKSIDEPASVGTICVEAIETAREYPGKIATLLMPADTAWSDGGNAGKAKSRGARVKPESTALDEALRILRSGRNTVILLGGSALSARATESASRIASKSGARIRAELLNARIDRSPDGLSVRRLPFHIDNAVADLRNVEHILLFDADPPNAFFAYPGRPSAAYPSTAKLHVVADHHEDAIYALNEIDKALEERIGAPVAPDLAAPRAQDSSAAIAAAVLADQLPMNAVVVDEAISLGELFYDMLAGAAPHSWLQLTGGAIGIGLPLSVGAAIAAPNRRVVALQADGSGMYTVQALWTQARENLDITTVILSNRSYAILFHEMQKMNAEVSQRGKDMLRLERPEIDWVHISNGFGVPAVRADTADEFRKALQESFGRSGPSLIELVL
ncbi:acetolactate synthase large subunit [Paraburkholderia sp. J7]|uniref:acetolactate synthase large subunit n=1 Tax=Paraburkholderia sp. J7 TaxID=2805438 RepID=UPI002AB7A369|nr:acetolactate synthase large subunit [Paraburkholderia sp. J7]